VGEGLVDGMEQTDRCRLRWVAIAVASLLCLFSAGFLAFWYVVWPVSPGLVIRHSPWIIPQVRALGKMNIQDDYWREGEDRFRQIVQEPDSRAQSALVSCLRTADPSVRFAALELVHLIAQHEVMNSDLVSEIIRAMKDTDRDVREHALTKMGYLPRAQAETMAIATFDSGDQDLQFIAVLSMSKVGNRVLIPRLIALLENSQSHVRSHALFLLYMTRDVGAISAVLPFLHDKDPNAALWAGKFMDSVNQSPAPPTE
jgi:hypothetical protein